jgi:Rrf2 family protein
MFSQKVEYALRAVVYLAGQDGPCTTDQIAEATKVPRAYLSKVIQDLVHAELLQSQRGAGGGVSLLISAKKLTILQVVNAVEPLQRIKTCPLGLASHGEHLCPLHARMDKALASVEKAFASTTLAEVLAEPSSSIPLCDFPAAKSKAKVRC